jgi:hypothetical protein
MKGALPSLSSSLSAVAAKAVNQTANKTPQKVNILPLIEVKKPDDYDHWIKCKDENNYDKIYYHNTVTSETSWLLPCNICFTSADKWCLQCNVSYCDSHFQKRHTVANTTKEGDADQEHFSTHQWSLYEIESTKEEATSGQDEYCLHCEVKIASRLCSICWDAYCNRCFDLIHHVGALKEHKPLNLKRAKLGWFIKRGKTEDERDLYVNGFTGDERSEKPTELMNDLERILLQNWKSHEKAVEDYSKIVEDLREKVEKATKERDKVTVELATLANQIKTKLEERKKQIKGGKR